MGKGKTNKPKVIFYLAALAFFVAMDGQGCSEIRLGYLPKQTSQPSSVSAAPMWQAPTVTTDQCATNSNTTITLDSRDQTFGINFLCGAFKNITETFNLAPNMHFFISSGLNPQMTISELSVSSGLYPSESANQALLTQLDQAMTGAGATITYRQVSGTTNILTPVGSGVIYSVVTPSEEGSYEYQVQGQNQYGVSPVKTIHINIVKAGVDPVASPKCSGFNNTVYMDLNKYLSGRLVSKHYGVFGQNSALVVKVTLPQTGYLNIQDVGNGWNFSTKNANISSRPCDFTTNDNTFYRRAKYIQQIGPFNFDQAMITTANTFYINVQNGADSQGCSAQGYTDCAQTIDYGWIHTTPDGTGNPGYIHSDFAVGECSAAYTATVAWNASTNSYDLSHYTSCVATPYADPYYVK